MIKITQGNPSTPIKTASKSVQLLFTLVGMHNKKTHRQTDKILKIILYYELYMFVYLLCNVTINRHK